LFKGKDTPDRYTKVKDNFFSLGANNRKSSESATPGLSDFAQKTLYLLEELPPGKIYSSLLKQITSRNDQRSRGLYQGNTTIEFIGKLFINANIIPPLGEEAPVWDRAVFIPFDTRYVNNNEKVDEAKFRLPSDNARKNYIVSLTSAFMTVCLKELHKFLSQYQKEHDCMPTNLPLPTCVQELIQTEKEKAFPLKIFIKNLTKEEIGATHVTTTTFFNAFRGFLRQRNIRSTDTLDHILDKLPRTGVTTTTDDDGNVLLVDRILTPQALILAEREAINTRQIDVPDPSTYPLKRAFDHQEEVDNFKRYKRIQGKEEKEEEDFFI
jgi:hypothetical protein